MSAYSSFSFLWQAIIKEEIDIASIVAQMLKAKVRVLVVACATETQLASNLKPKPKLKPKPRLAVKPEPVTVPLKDPHGHETDMRDDGNGSLLLGMDLGQRPKVKVRVPVVLRVTEVQLASDLKAKPRLAVKPEPVTVPLKEPHRLETDVLDDDNNSPLLGADLGWTNKPKVRVPGFSNTT
jgi:hypothetical protein